MKNNLNILSLSSKELLKELEDNSNHNFYYYDYLYKELISRSNNEKQISGIYKDILKFLITTFSKLVYRDDQEDVKEIPCWHGNPERVVARLKQDSLIILPVASIIRISDSDSNQRRRHDRLIQFDTYLDKTKNRAIRVASLAPTPTNVTYKLSLWTKYHEDMDQLAEQVKRMFNPHLRLKTKEDRNSPVYLVQESSNIDVTIADGKDRLIRRSFMLSLETYIPNPKFMITNSGEIKEFNLDALI